MGRAIHKLSQADLKKTTPGRYADGGNLYLCVTEGSHGPNYQWLFRYAIRGKTRTAGLGSARTFTLAEAREEARLMRQLVSRGVDVVDHRRRAKRAAFVESQRQHVFETVAAEFWPSQRRRFKREKHHKSVWSLITRFAFPVLGKVPVAEVTPALVAKLLEPHWLDMHASMLTLRVHLHEVFAFAKAKGYSPPTSANPAEISEIKRLLPAVGKREKKHFEAVEWKSIPALWTKLAEDDSTAADALRLVILTATRSREVADATWPEIDAESRALVIPEGRMKGGRAFAVPLSDQALQIVEKRKGEHRRYLFAGRGGVALSEPMMREALKRAGFDATVHGMRSAFRSWCGDTGQPDDIAEAALAHANGGGNAVTAAYLRSSYFERRAKLMQDWAAFVTSQGVGLSPDNSTSPRRNRVERYVPREAAAA